MPVVVPAMIPVTVMVASFAGFLQLPAALLRLPAVVSVMALSIAKILFGFAYLLFAFIVAIPGLNRSSAAEKESAD